MTNKIVGGLLISAALFAGGCRKYDTPEYVEIKTNESAFMIPLEGNTKDQTSFESEDFLQKNLIAVKRVQIPHRWNKTGRGWLSGTWMDTVRVITVDRSPISRYWVDTKAIDVETNDSVSLSMDVTCTAMIESDDVSKFLFRYPQGSLETVMDQEIRARVQTALTASVAKLSLEDLKLDKTKVLEPLSQEVIPFFKERGITITVLGLGGGINYRNPKIQEAIDKTVQDQQLVISAEAKYQAQLKENETIKAQADAVAQATLTKAKGEAEGIKALADAKAYETQKAQAGGSSYVALRQLEVLNNLGIRWDGRLPTYMFGGQSPQMLMGLPNDAK